MPADLKSLAPEWTHGAIIYLMNRDGAVQATRPAAFVWATESGIEWVEPSYADPWGAATPAHHARTGTWASFNALQADDYLLEALPFDPEQPESEGIAGPLRWFADHLNRQGTTWAAERARMRALLDQDRATPPEA